MEKQEKLKAIRRVYGHETLLKGDEACFWCLKHSHDPGRTVGQLSVNLKEETFHCWTCDFGGRNLLPLMQRGTPEREQYYQEIQSRQGIRKIETKTYDQPVLPAEFETLSRLSDSPYYHQAMEYLSRRGITTEDIWLYKLGYCGDGEYRGRIIIPSFDEYGELNFFVGRSWDPKIPHGLRYKAGNFNKDIITNDCMIDWDRPVVLTEGPFDAIKAGTNSIPLQGSMVRENSRLFEKIVLRGVDVYFALDSDILKKQLWIIGRFLEYGVNSYFVNLGDHKDVGEMQRGEFESFKRQAVPVKSDLDLLKIRVQA